MDLRHFFAELRRRRVIRVAGIYALVSWAVIQVADTVFPALMIPDWALRLVVVLVLLGLPIALVIAWAFEITPDGVRRTGTTPASQPRPRGLPGPVLAAGVVLLVALAGFGLSTRGLGPQGGDAATADSSALGLDRSIAVLPFTDMSAEGDQAYFSDGITEDILTKLSKLGSLKVISRTTVMQYKGTTKTLREIGDELGVGVVLEGSVRRAGDQVRITAQLIDARTDAHLWAETYDRRVTDVFAIQSEIAGEIASALRLQLDEGDRSRLAGGGTGSFEAYELYLRGREQVNRTYASRDDWRSIANNAITLYRRALEHDPSYARAYAGIAWAFRLHPDFGANATDSVAFYAQRAAEFDPDLPEAQVELGYVHLLRYEDQEATRRFEQALRLDPGSADAISALAERHTAEGRLDDALLGHLRAAEVDPTSYLRALDAGFSYMDLGMLDDAERWFRKALDGIVVQPGRLNCHLGSIALRRGDSAEVAARITALVEAEPRATFPRRCAVSLAVAIGDADAARTHTRRFDELSGGDDSLSGILRAQVALLDGRRDEALGHLKRQEEEIRQRLDGQRAARGSDLFHLAHIHALRGERDAAIATLQRAYEAGWRGGANQNIARRGPGLTALRGDPRMQQILSRVESEVARMRARVEREQG